MIHDELTCSFNEGSQFSSLLCSSCDLISTGWFGWDSTKDLVVYKDRSMSQTCGRPRITVIGLCKHHSSSCGEKASCLFLTWTQGVLGRSWDSLNFGSWDLRLGTGQGSPSSKHEVDMGPEPGPTRSHSLTISLADIWMFIFGVGWGFTSSSSPSDISVFTVGRLLIRTTQGFTGLGSWAAPLAPLVRRGEVDPPLESGEERLTSSWDRFLCCDLPGAVPYREIRIFKLVSSLDTSTGLGLSFLADTSDSSCKINYQE